MASTSHCHGGRWVGLGLGECNGVAGAGGWRFEGGRWVHWQAGMRLDYKNSAHSENCLVLTNLIVKKTLFHDRPYKRAVGSLVWLSA